MPGGIRFEHLPDIAILTHPERLKQMQLYGDNVFEKCGINRDGAGEVGKPRYFNGKRHF